MRRLLSETAILAAMAAAVPALPSCTRPGSGETTVSRISGISGIRSVAAGSAHTCALLSDGTAWCWGSNHNGMLGNTERKESAAPVRVAGLPGAVSLAAGNMHTCAVLKDGTAVCWGSNHHGQLGSGVAPFSPLPAAVKGLSNARAVAAGWYHTCALLDGGEVACWGENREGQLGTGDSDGPEFCRIEEADVPCSRSAVKAAGLAGASSISAGGNHSCAVSTDGSLLCWGANYHGELGIATSQGPDLCGTKGNRVACSESPRIVKRITDAVRAAAGGYHTCYVTTDSMTKCWGPNRMGQLAREGGKGSWSPVAVPLSERIVDLCAGLMHNCAVTAGGKALCWGSNTSGQLGIPPEKTPPSGRVAGHSAPPIVVTLPGNARSVSCGTEHTCAVLDDGTAACWGGRTAPFGAATSGGLR
jgi:alpha-tubulin suppressor-like RCC1 family protein